jgi:hypothetical protein
MSSHILNKTKIKINKNKACKTKSCVTLSMHTIPMTEPTKQNTEEQILTQLK